MGEPIHIITESRKDYERRNYKERLGISEILSFILIFGGIFLFVKNIKVYGVIAFVVGILWLFFNYKKSRKRIIARRKGSDWERIDKLPNWTFRKMKRRKTNKVNGEYYVYKKEGDKFYKKKK